MPYGKGYDNLDDAAAAALFMLSLQPRVQGQEYMTLLVRDPSTGMIRREAFQTQGQRDRSAWTGHPEGQVEGVVHSHPPPRTGDKYRSTMFSAADIGTAHDLGKPSYIAAMGYAPEGQTPVSQDRRYTPQGRPAPRPMAGEEFLAQFPIEELIAHIDRRSAFTQAAAAARAKGNPMRLAAAEK